MIPTATYRIQFRNGMTFDRAAVVELTGFPASETAYVGDRLDNDVLPAADAGMRPVLIRRGPWGYLHAERPEASRVDVIDSLTELPDLLAG